MINQNCIICGKPLKNGIIICGRKICGSCEIRLINSNMDTDFYEYYKDCVKRNLTKEILERGEK
ncbi:MAG: sigma factor G inhibitor Gin [Clostridiaceae bacterium]